MQSDLPKVVHEVAGRPMVCWVIDACAQAGCSRIIVVVGYRQDDVRAAVEQAERGEAAIEFAVQEEQLGTGHAVTCTKHLFDREVSESGHGVFVLAGDGPLIRAETLEQILERHGSGEGAASATLATAVLDDPTGYGRIIRDASGGFREIVEQKNATEEQRAVREVNPSYYCFDVRDMFEALTDVKRNELSGEYYLTDVPALLLERNKRVDVIDAVPSEDVLSINTLEHLANVDQVLRRRLANSTGTQRQGAST